MWNNLPLENRTTEYVRHQMSHQPNLLYYEGARSANVKHAQLRMNCSKLNSHLFSLHVIDSPQCECGHNIEDSNHYLLECPMYFIPRQKMLRSLNNLISITDVHVSTLLYGCDKYDFNKNKSIVMAVQDFIIESNRL